jgi:hypothetical protein
VRRLTIALVAVCACGDGHAEERAPDPASDSGLGSDAIAADVAQDVATEVAPDVGFTTAAHPRMPLIVQQRGSVAAAPVITPITFASTYVNAVSDFDAFVQQIVTQPFWPATTAEYGVGKTTVQPPVHLGEAAPASITSSDIDAWLAAKIESGAAGFADATDDSLFVVYYPSSTTITRSGLKMCTGFGGYHEDVTATISGKTVHPMIAVLPECVTPAGSPPGTPTTLEQLTTSVSHEMVEAVTDPYVLHFGGSPPYPAFIGTSKGTATFDPYIAWTFAIHGTWSPLETADICEKQSSSYFTPSGFPYQVQRTWSNANATAGRDPCAPLRTDQGPYFLAQPVFDPSFATNEAMDPPVYLPAVNFTAPEVTPGAKPQTQGIHIAVGEKGTLPLVLWSVADTPSWDVTVADAIVPPGFPSSYLRFSLDRSSGANGDTLLLTIEVLALDATRGGRPFIVRSTRGAEQHVTYGFVSSS